MNKHEDAALIASNFGPISREERKALEEEASGYSKALEEALFKGTSVYKNHEIVCYRSEGIVKFKIKEIYQESNSEKRIPPAVDFCASKFGTISRTGLESSIKINNKDDFMRCLGRYMGRM